MYHTEFCVQIRKSDVSDWKYDKKYVSEFFLVLLIHKTYVSEWDMRYWCIRIWLISYVSESNVSGNSISEILCNFEKNGDMV